MRFYHARKDSETGTGTDFSTPEQAIAYVETGKTGSVILFIGERNLPGCLPEIVKRSCAYWTFDKGKWFAREIFGGIAQIIGEEKPN